MSSVTCIGKYTNDNILTDTFTFSGDEILMLTILKNNRNYVCQTSEQETISFVQTGPAGVPALSHVGEELGLEQTETVWKTLTSKGAAFS